MPISSDIPVVMLDDAVYRLIIPLLDYEVNSICPSILHVVLVANVPMPALQHSESVRGKALQVAWQVVYYNRGSNVVFLPSSYKAIYRKVLSQEFQFTTSMLSLYMTSEHHFKIMLMFHPPQGIHGSFHWLNQVVEV